MPPFTCPSPLAAPAAAWYRPAIRRRDKSAQRPDEAVPTRRSGPGRAGCAGRSGPVCQAVLPLPHATGISLLHRRAGSNPVERSGVNERLQSALLGLLRQKSYLPVCADSGHSNSKCSAGVRCKARGLQGKHGLCRKRQQWPRRKETVSARSFQRRLGQSRAGRAGQPEEVFDVVL